MAKLNIITPVHNQWIFTENYIKDLSHLDENHEIIIIDNNSTDGTYYKINELINNLQFKCKFTIIKNFENTGFALGSNIGYQKSQEDIVLFLNNDIRVDKPNLYTWTNYIFDTIEDNCIYSPTGGLIDSKYNFIYETTNNNKQINYLSGWLMYGKRSTFEKIKNLENDYNGEKKIGPFTNFGTYFEDTYLSFQCFNNGIKLKMIPNIGIKHIGRQTSKILDTKNMYLSAKRKFITLMEQKKYGTECKIL